MWQKEIEAIENDTLHGATYLTKKAAHLLASLHPSQAKEAAKRLLHIQPCMAPLYNLAHDFLQTPVSDPKTFCKEWWQAFEKENALIVSKAAKMVAGKRILTHSFSSMVHDAIVSSSTLQVLCTESRPKNEGVALAQKLCSKGIQTKLIIDGAAPFMVARVDMVLLGADGIGDFGFVHKIGTYAIALAAKKERVPLVVMAGEKRRWPKEYKMPRQKVHDPEEIATGCFEVHNIYFDLTPLDCIDTFIF